MGTHVDSIVVKVAAPYAKRAQKYIGWDKEHTTMTDFVNNAFKMYLAIQENKKDD